MRLIVTLLLCTALTLALFSCGGQKAEETAGPTPSGAPAEKEQAMPQGAPYDCKYFSLTLAEGWAATTEKFGMVNILPTGKISPGLYFKFEGEGNAAGTAEASIASMIQTYGGSPVETTTIAGVEFKTTTYTYSGMEQTMHVAFRQGTKITITIEGLKAKDNPDIKAMLSSFVLK